MKIEIDITAFDEIFKAIIVEDWQNTKKECDRLKAIENKFTHHKEDLKYQKKLKKFM